MGTVLFFTLDPTFEASGNPNVGVGNARISLDEDALGKIATDQVRSISDHTEGSVVRAKVREDGLITFDITLAGALNLGIKSSITVDPEVTSGQLELNVVEASLGELALPEQVADMIEGPLQGRLDALAGNLEYRLTSIQTADRRLTLEIEV
ncbi:MAG: hypothetical protein M0R74_09025 [Dehalococcoidia bacterium]|nr:hypothetical protein [Dehalococcoidia bacterium]